MKKVIITGTSSGIGYQMCKIFAQNGYKVLALSRNIKPIEDLKHGNIKSLSIDLSKSKDLNKVSKYVKDSSYGKVDILIHNAGKLIKKPFLELTRDDFQNIYQVNVFGVAELTKKIIPFLSKGSHVVTISSVGGVQGSLKFPGLSAYCSSKGALIALSELLAEEYKDKGIHFNSLALGAVQTKMLEKAFPNLKAGISAKEMASYIFEFSTKFAMFHNGKVIQVSSSTP